MPHKATPALPRLSARHFQPLHLVTPEYSLSFNGAMPALPDSYAALRRQHLRR